LVDNYNEGQVNGINADGSAIVGFLKNSVSSTYQAFKWTASGGSVGLGGTYASGVTADGKTIVGADVNGPGIVTWSADGTVTPVLGFTTGIANGISSDGGVIVGYSSHNPVYWTEQTGVVSLPLMPSTDFGQAMAVSGDGSTVVGYNESPQYVIPPGDSLGDLDTDFLGFRWTASGGLEPLGHLAESEPGHSDVLVECVNGDGTIIGGDATGGAFVWDESHGMRYLSDVLASEGVDVQGWSFSNVTGISADGRAMVGTAWHNGILSDFLAEVPTSVWVPEPGSAVLFMGATVLVMRRRR
jgi:uncharacterized membrane protein